MALSRRTYLANARSTLKVGRGQGMAEFALVLPLLLLVVIGIIEAGRLLVIYSSVQAASREAARYAAAAGEVSPGLPYYLDTAGIVAAARRVAILIAPPQVEVRYDRGPGTSPFTPTSPHDVKLGDRVVVTVSARYDPILGLTPLQGFNITATTARTVIKEVSIESGGGLGGGSNPPLVTITAPNNGAIFAAGETVCFTATALDSEDGNLSSSLQWSCSPGSQCPNSGNLGTGGTRCHTFTNVGDFTIVARVTDSSGLVGSDTITIIIETPNAPPQVTILSPSNGLVEEEGYPIHFEATATDAEDGDLSSAIRWFSNIDLWLRDGAAFDYPQDETLSLGTHIIRAEVTDSGGKTSSANITLTLIPRRPPTLTILAPEDGDTYPAGYAILFLAQAEDAKDGDLSAQIQWSCSPANECPNNGNLGTGSSLNIPFTSPGTYTITAQVTDRDNLSASASLTLQVVDTQAPVVNIKRPINGTSFSQGATVEFRGTATDAVDGDLSENLEWFSNLVGQIGQGRTFTRNDLPPGTHLITAQVRDSSNNLGQKSITIIIEANNEPPTVEITAPAEGASFRQTEVVTFSATASDPEQGDLSSLVQWISSLNGTLGTGATITTTTLSVGTHVITATVVDNLGQRASDTVTIQIRQLVCPTPGTVTFSPSGGAWKDKASWRLTVPPGNTDTFTLTDLRVDLINHSNARVTSITIGATSIGSDRIAQQGSWFYVITPPPVWSGTFQANGTLDIIFNFNPQVKKGNGSITFRATFELCPTIQSVASP